MSSDSNDRRPAGQKPQPARPGTGFKTMRSGTLLLLVLVDFFVAALMVIETTRFIVSPDPAVKAGPMYVVLALTTGSALLMFVMALNASFVPLMSPQRGRDVRLVMWTMGATGIVTGMLTLGAAVQGIIMRLAIGVIAFVFISAQEARLSRARTVPGQAAPGRQSAAPRPKTRPKTRQRRGGRKH